MNQVVCETGNLNLQSIRFKFWNSMYVGITIVVLLLDNYLKSYYFRPTQCIPKYILVNSNIQVQAFYKICLLQETINFERRLGLRNSLMSGAKNVGFVRSTSIKRDFEWIS